MLPARNSGAPIVTFSRDFAPNEKLNGLMSWSMWTKILIFVRINKDLKP